MRIFSVTTPWRRALALTAALAAFGLLISTAAGLRAGSVQGKELQHRVSVSFKLVQVYVTGKDGKVVGDLTAEDFEVSDNRQVQTVTHFEKHFLGAEEGPAGPSAIPSTNRKFFLVFDFAFMDIRGVVKSKDAALKFLETEIRPNDEIGLVTYSISRGLVLHEYLTTDHARIRTIVDGFGLRHHAGRAENLTDFVYASDLAEEQMWGRLQEREAGTEAQFYENQARLQTGKRLDEGRRQGYVEQAQDFVIALGQLAKVFRYIPGFKNVILFSGGIAKQLIFGKRGGAVVGEWTTPDQLAQELSDYDSAQADTGLRSEFTQMLKEFKASNSPVYAVDVTRTMRDSDANLTESYGPEIREFEGADSLKQLASGTGGKFYANTLDNVKIADDIQTITSAYYVLGYSVDEKWDGKFHKIKVKVKRKGVEVMAQGGYFGAKPFKDYTAFEKLLHIVDLALSDTPQVQIPFEIPVSAMPILVKGWPQLLVFGRTSLAIHNEALGKKAEAYLLLFDGKGDMAYIKKFRMAIPESGKETLFPVFLLPVKPGAYSCRIIIRNMDTGRGARGAAPLVMLASASAAFSLDPPLLLSPDTRSLDLEASPGDSLAGLFAYDANAYAPLLGDMSSGQAKLHAGLRLTGVSVGGGVEVTASLVDQATSARTEIPVSVLRQAADGATKLLFVEIATGELKPGRYTIAFTAKDAMTGRTAASSADVTVK